VDTAFEYTRRASRAGRIEQQDDRESVLAIRADQIGVPGQGGIGQRGIQHKRVGQAGLAERVYGGKCRRHNATILGGRVIFKIALDCSAICGIGSDQQNSAVWPVHSNSPPGRHLADRLQGQEYARQHR
jgi:hypothetical protein